ncbi:hypothetical protein TVAGG3_0302560 [Trichomonas vaginalis G3]|uniref:hypothetical protein n=1 Tax=Trichomonas vaginalis (strain ATCC PRA-98 / G3) TaxID=412133 RepID=UPI0021E5D582|nr:hypothetical protein TVAGG3_0302560 [Trichomonas vaginalis G3]KAI5528006.1 hypothetical protein TVAGG3_0302560 [Trichomonas vaginalis G3]
MGRCNTKRPTKGKKTGTPQKEKPKKEAVEQQDKVVQKEETIEQNKPNIPASPKKENVQQDKEKTEQNDQTIQNAQTEEAVGQDDQDTTIGNGFGFEFRKSNYMPLVFKREIEIIKDQNGYSAVAKSINLPSIFYIGDKPYKFVQKKNPTK